MKKKLEVSCGRRFENVSRIYLLGGSSRYGIFSGRFSRVFFSIWLFFYRYLRNFVVK